MIVIEHWNWPKNRKKYNNINRVVIVDNKSTDNSVEYLENQTESCDKIDILKARSNKGFAAGNNIGARYVTKNINQNIFCLLIQIQFLRKMI